MALAIRITTLPEVDDVTGADLAYLPVGGFQAQGAIVCDRFGVSLQRGLSR